MGIKRFALLALILCLAAPLNGCGSLNGDITRVVNPPFGLVPTRAYAAQTPDGWTLNVIRINGTTGHSPRLPVVLCHGFGHNGFVWRLGGRQSFAQYLARNGYDVWIPDLRGSGASSKPGFSAMRTFIKSPFTWLEQIPHIVTDFTKINWTVDDHIRFDIPRIIDLVKDETGAGSVNWIGHSMGGMIALAYMEDEGHTRNDIHAITAIASPMVISHPLNDIMRVIRDNNDLFQTLNLFVTQSVPSMLNAATGANLQNGLDYLFYNSNNMERLTVMELLFYVVEDISPGCLKQFSAMVRDGEFKSADGSINYAANLKRITIPVFAVAGKADNLAEPGAIRYLYRHLGSQDKTFKLFGIAAGTAMDYGHTDLIVGKRSSQEIFPHLEAWLLAHSTPRPKAGPSNAPLE